ncbi:Endo-beta-glucanase [Neofusicoccum parvum]|uniref:Endo-beta-glucanase n=1 Tax=Neofusicoccum parvum TaxID=310453 RepID=A0ACB5SEG0_9PEZI|nr:Endo-beta-glucanase [Neofusicoccum parvum]
MPAGNCAEEYSSSGCRAQATTPKNYGDAFNANGGGIYAMQWTSSFIKLWFFPRDEVDQKIQDVIDMDPDSVDVSAFGLPETTFAGGRGCDVDEHFKEHRIIFDTTFCGDWGGNSWPSRCPSVTGKKRKESCEIYVGAHPEKYKETYWEINSIMVFKEGT